MVAAMATATVNTFTCTRRQKGPGEGPFFFLLSLFRDRALGGYRDMPPAVSVNRHVGDANLVALAAAEQCGLPIHAIGVGEKLDDLRPFDPDLVAKVIAGVGR